MRSTSVVVAVIGVIICVGCGPWKEGTQISLKSTSPDGRYRLQIVEITRRLDRNFFLRLSDTRTGLTTNIFYSPDEGRPVGTERVIWSRDSTRFFMVGKKFLVEDQGQLADGRQLYLLYDVRSGDLKCNASQQDRYGGFTRAEIDAIDWLEKIEPDVPANGSEPIRSETNRTSSAAGFRR